MSSSLAATAAVRHLVNSIDFRQTVCLALPQGYSNVPQVFLAVAVKQAAAKLLVS